MSGLLGPLLSKFINNEGRKLIVWSKGIVVPGRDPNLYRQDYFGNLLKFDDYGKCVITGWEIDHIIPKNLGGSDELVNLQPLHWYLNKKKSDKLVI